MIELTFDTARFQADLDRAKKMLARLESMPRRVPSYRPPTLPRRPNTVARQRYENRPERRADRDFYKSREWRDTREVKLGRDPLCEPCKRRGLTVVAKHVHHKLERKTHPELAFDLDNLESCCAPCHNRKRKAQP